MEFKNLEAHPFHANHTKQFGFCLDAIEELQKALMAMQSKVEELEAAIAAGSQGPGPRTVAQEPQPQLPAEAQDYCRKTFGIDKFPKNTQAAIVKHSAALAGLPSIEDLQGFLAKMDHGKGFAKQDLMARWVVGEAEFGALTYFLQKINQIEFSSREWRRVAK